MFIFSNQIYFDIDFFLFISDTFYRKKALCNNYILSSLSDIYTLGSFINHVDIAGGGRFAQCPLSIFLHKPYLVKGTTKGEGGQKYPKNCPHGL